MKKLLIGLFRKMGFSVKVTRLGVEERYKVKSDIPGLDLHDTPTGKYYLPSFLQHDAVANTIKAGEYFDAVIIDVAKQYLGKDASLLDIGANYGQMSVVLAKYIAQQGSGKVYAFEAEPFVGDVLQHNIEVNGCTNIIEVRGAVYNEPGIELVFPEPDFKKFSAYGSYGIDPLAKDGRKVTTLTVDSLNIPDKIGFIKVDIQGCDLFALQGARETIRRYQPAIIFEYEEQFQEEFKTSFNDYVEFIHSIGYKFVRTFMDINYLAVPR